MKLVGVPEVPARYGLEKLKYDGPQTLLSFVHSGEHARQLITQHAYVCDTNACQ